MRQNPFGTPKVLLNHGDPVVAGEDVPTVRDRHRVHVDIHHPPDSPMLPMRPRRGTIRGLSCGIDWLVGGC